MNENIRAARGLETVARLLVAGSLAVSGCAERAAAQTVATPAATAPATTEIPRIPTATELIQKIETQMIKTPTAEAKPTETVDATPRTWADVKAEFLLDITNKDGKMVLPEDMGKTIKGTPQTWSKQDMDEAAAILGQTAVDELESAHNALVKQNMRIDTIKRGIDGKGYAYTLVNNYCAVGQDGAFTYYCGGAGPSIKEYQRLPDPPVGGERDFVVKSGNVLQFTYTRQPDGTKLATGVFNPASGKWEGLNNIDTNSAADEATKKMLEKIKPTCTFETEGKVNGITVKSTIVTDESRNFKGGVIVSPGYENRWADAVWYTYYSLWSATTHGTEEEFNKLVKAGPVDINVWVNNPSNETYKLEQRQMKFDITKNQTKLIYIEDLNYKFKGLTNDFAAGVSLQGDTLYMLAGSYVVTKSWNLAPEGSVKLGMDAGTALLAVTRTVTNNRLRNDLLYGELVTNSNCQP